MIKNSFIHIKGIGNGTERKLWSSGIKSWAAFRNSVSIPFSDKKVEFIRKELDLSEKNLRSNNPNYFTNALKSNQHWRIFRDFKSSVAYLDIETTGLDSYSSIITTIALYDGQKIDYYVNGENLHDFVRDIQKYKLLVTYNGKCFDIPFIEKYFNISLNQAQIDLRYVLKSLGYSGGLKGCEQQLGISRGDLDGVDGSFAVYLWQEYLRSKKSQVLETLLAYNIEDVVNLEFLMHKAYNLKLHETPFKNRLSVKIPKRPSVPFKPDKKIIKSVKDSYHFYY